MIWWPLVFLIQAHAQDMSVEKYCFSSPNRMEAVQSRLQVILVPADKLDKDGSCFTLQMKPHRRELLQNYIKNLDPAVKIDFSSEEMRKEHCHLQTERTRISDSNQTQIGYNGQVQLENQTTHKEAVETSKIQTLGPFSLRLNRTLIEGDCRPLSSNRYRIKLKYLEEPIKINPTYYHSAGTPPPVEILNQQTMHLETEVDLMKGQSLDLGGTFQDLKNKSYKVSAPDQIKLDELKSPVSEKVILRLD